MMPLGDCSNKERQSVYEKALVVCHEGEKELSLLQEDLDRSKLQTFISYKLEERELRNELFRIKREQRSLAKEAKQRQRDNKSIDDIAKEMKAINPGNRGATAIMLEKKFSLPKINCTQKNVPKILQRKLSHESEYFTWKFGLPKVENAVKALNPEGGQKKKGKAAENGKGLEDSHGAEDGDLVIHKVVYNVPVAEPKKEKAISQNLPSVNTKLPRINLTASQQAANVLKQTGNIMVDKLSKKHSNRLELPKI